MEESKNTRIAFALLCGLAVCCSVMYITSDGAEIMAEDSAHQTGSGQDVFDPSSVDSTDVIKTGLLYTKTPDTIAKGANGRERLLTFMDKVEANIAKEVEERKADIAAIRAQMAKNMEFNAEARKKMKKMLLAKMAVNAKKAKDDLNAAMRHVQKEFADAAALESQRNTATLNRSKKTREIMAKNKAQGAKDLQMAVAAQQRALATLAQATNARIKSTNKHIAENSAQIKENAKKARQDLDDAMDAFDNKMANVKEEASKGRSKLAAQAVAQDKKFRQYANNQIKQIAAKTAAQFHDVRTKMAEDRANADQALAHMTARLSAAMHTRKVLQDKRFAQTVSDIDEAKKEANDRVEGFRSHFKTSILDLAGVVEAQNTKLNARVDQLSGTIANNKAAQADINNKVNAELKRMQKVGNDRYQEHLDKDAELKALMEKNKQEAQEAMQREAEQFFGEITKIKDQMKKDKAHAENALASATTKLFETIEKNGEAQAAVNKELTEATRRAELNAAEALKEAKEGFSTKIAGLHTTVNELAKKHTGEITKLTGIVEENAIKDFNGRAELRKIQNFNKNFLSTAVSDAVHKGEQRALQIESKMKDVNQKTRAQMNNKITTEISALQKDIHAQITDLTLETKEARAAMKKEILFAIKSAEAVAKENLEKTVQWAEGKFSALHSNLAQHEKESAEARAGLKAQIDQDKKDIIEQLGNAVKAQERAVLAYRQEMCEQAGVLSGVYDSQGKQSEESSNCAGGKLNKKLTGHYEQMLANTEEVAATMAANTEQLIGSLEAAKSEADSELAAADAASKQRYDETMDAVASGVKEAAEKSKTRFAGAYQRMAQNAIEFNEQLTADVYNLNDKIAKAAALEDERFSKTVKDIKAAKAQARDEVAQAKKDFAAGLLLVNSNLREVETRLNDEISVVSADVMDERAAQKRVNDEVTTQINELIKLNDRHTSTNKRARAAIKEVMDKNKQIAADEVEALKTEAMKSIAEAAQLQADNLAQFGNDLSEATKNLYDKLAKDNAQQQAAHAALEGQLDVTKQATKDALAAAEELFKSRFMSLNNQIIANAEFYQETMAEHTGIVMDWKKASDADRKDIRAVRDAMVANLHKDIAHFIQKAEAEIKAVEETANLSIVREKKYVLTTISESVENMADNVFVTIQEGRAKIADNYLSLKAYAATAADAVTDYLAKGKGRNLSSIGDLLNTLGQMSDVKVEPATGEGFGASEMTTIFSGEVVKMDSSITKINGLVNEYIHVVGEIKARWPMGLGKYLIGKLEVAMQGPGALEVDKVEDKPGNFVFMNAHSVGLSSKLPDFQSLAVSMSHYEATLSAMTTHLPEDKKAAHKDIHITPPEWQGN